MVPVAALMPSNLGTRQSEDLPEELLADIVKRGIRQPLRLRRAATDAGRYEIICGYRRWRVAQRLGLAQLPATICSDEDGPAVLASLVENLRQGDLSVVEEAQAYFRLLTRYAMDIAAVMTACERDRQHIVRRMRLLGLPPRLRQLIATGAISADHADLLLDAANPEGLADAIVAEHLSIETARQRLGASRKPESSL
jgi:ParB family chromosome partitioning protein